MPFISDRAKKDAAASGSSSKGGYLNPSSVKDGESARFALLTDNPLEFFELWGASADNPKSRKPFRFENDPTPEDLEEAMGGEYVRPLNQDGTSKEPIKLAQAVPIYNQDLERVQVFQWNQKTITSQFDAISQLEDYSDSFLDIDFVLSRTGEGKETTYNLQAVPRKKGTTAAIKEAWSEAQEEGFDISRLIGGGDPFKEKVD